VTRERVRRERDLRRKDLKEKRWETRGLKSYYFNNSL
jgi:hypothetical protein